MVGAGSIARAPQELEPWKRAHLRVAAAEEREPFPKPQPHHGEKQRKT